MPVTVRIGRAALLAAALAIAGCGGVAVSGAPGSPSPAPVSSSAAVSGPSAPSVPSASPAPSASTAPSASPPIDPGATPSPAPSATTATNDVLPAPEGARRTATRATRDDGVRQVTVVYRVRAAADAVRAHYRGVLRADGWTLTGVETDGGEWELDARRGRREVEIELRPAGDETIVEVTVSDPAAP